MKYTIMSFIYIGLAIFYIFMKDKGVEFWACLGISNIYIAAAWVKKDIKG